MTVAQRIQPLYLVCFLVLVVLASTGRLEARTYHSFNHAYSLSLPEDWDRIPDEILTVKAPTLPLIRTGRGMFEIAFQPLRNQKWMEYPYIVVEAVPYHNLGFEQQVDDRQIVQIVKANTGMDPAKLAAPDMQIMDGGAEYDVPERSITLSQQARRFTWSNATDVEGVGPVRTQQWGFFGRNCLIQVTLYERGKGSDRLRDMACAVADSFKFELGREYKPPLTIDDLFGTARGAVGTSTGVIVTAGCVGTAVVFAIVAMFSARPKPAEDEVDS